MTRSEVHADALVELLALDGSSRQRLHLLSLTRTRRAQSFLRLLTTLAQLGNSQAEELAARVSKAPAVLGTPSAYQHLLSILHVLAEGNDPGTAIQAMWPLGAAADITTGGQWRGVVPSDGYPFPPVIPLHDIIVTSESGEADLVLTRGDTAITRPLPAWWGVVLDPYDCGLRARAGETFQFFDADEVANRLSGWTLEVASEISLLRTLAPEMVRRLATRLVPVRADHVERAATHENVPEVTFVSLGRAPGGLGAALAHEEVHDVLNEMERCGVYELPDVPMRIEVAWRDDARPLKAVLHGIAAFGRMSQYWWRVALELGAGHARRSAAEQAEWVSQAITDVRMLDTHLPPEVESLLSHFRHVVDGVLSETAAPMTPVPYGRSAHEDASPTITARSAGAFEWLLFDHTVKADVLSWFMHSRDRLPWQRRTTSFYTHEVCEVTPGADGVRDALWDYVHRHLTPALGSALGYPLQVFKAELHRMTQGDYVGLHTDDGDVELSYRLVMGLDPQWHPDLGGQIGLHVSEAGGPSIQFVLTAGQALAFEIHDRSFHEVAEIRGPQARHTFVASMRRGAEGVASAAASRSSAQRSGLASAGSGVRRAPGALRPSVPAGGPVEMVDYKPLVLR